MGENALDLFGKMLRKYKTDTLSLTKTIFFKKAVHTDPAARDNGLSKRKFRRSSFDSPSASSRQGSGRTAIFSEVQ